MMEDSAYRRLLDHYYSTERPIPTPVEQVLRICRAVAPAEQDAVRFVLQHFFTKQSDGWHNPRVDRELQIRHELTEKKSKAGKASAQKRSSARATPEPTSVEQVLTQPQPQSGRQFPSPSSAAGFSFSSENKTLTTSNTRARVYTDEDFLARDLRKLRDAENEMEIVIKAQPNLAPEEIFEMTCERAGVSVADGLRAKEYQRKWPAAESVSA
jgi:uncharacterized protein YdaU (DUF1376 family)